MSSARAPTPHAIRENVPLKPYTTFKIGGPARYFVEIRSPEELTAAIAFAKERGIQTFVLGGGSNILVSDRGFDGRGNYSLGLREQLVFPEIEYDKIDRLRGLEITIVTTAKTDEEGLELLKALGMPFRSAAGGRAA